MFERYTEKARRTIFFARYESSQCGSEYIETEHLLLGLMREEKVQVHAWLPKLDYDSVRHTVESQCHKGPYVSTSVDLPLSDASQRVLAYAAQEADTLGHKHIATGHILLGLLRDKKSLPAKILSDCGADLAALRIEVRKNSEGYRARPALRDLDVRTSRTPVDTIEIHGSRFNTEYIREAVKRCRQYNWHWRKQLWSPRDIVVNRQTGSISFELILAEDTANFELIKAGWTTDHCAICRWALFESKDDPLHNEGYTNGREWVCTECYEKFWSRPDFFSSPYSDIT
jgi:hypothetical protein